MAVTADDAAAALAVADDGIDPFLADKRSSSTGAMPSSFALHHGARQDCSPACFGRVRRTSASSPRRFVAHVRWVFCLTAVTVPLRIIPVKRSSAKVCRRARVRVVTTARSPDESIASIFCLSVCILPACLGPKLVILNGVEMTYDDAAKRLYEQGQNALSNGDPTTRAGRFMEVVNRFEDAPVAPDALFALGAVFDREEGCRASGAHLGRFLNQHPGHPKAGGGQGPVTHCEGSKSLHRPGRRPRKKFHAANSDGDRPRHRSAGGGD